MCVGVGGGGGGGGAKLDQGEKRRKGMLCLDYEDIMGVEKGGAAPDRDKLDIVKDAGKIRVTVN